jgi:purine-binding chemotaxis protein CheW
MNEGGNLPTPSTRPAPPPGGAAADGDRLYCTFRLAGRLFGVDVAAVKEVNTHTALTPVPHAPAAVSGLVNLRGQLHLILDLRRLLGLGPAPVTPDSRLVILKPAVGESFGVLVDAVGEVVRVPAGQTESYRADDPARAGGLVTGVGKIEGDLVVIVDPYPLLEAVNQPDARAGGMS